MVGIVDLDPPTVNVSVHVPAVGCAVVNETKSKLNELQKRQIFVTISTKKTYSCLPELTDRFL